MSAVLSQQRHPIAFFSKKLSPRMQAASAYDREMFAISEAVRKWQQYLLGCNQRSLKSLLHQTIQTPGQQKWLTKLLGYDFEIHYTPGRDNPVADALSRLPSSTVLLFSAMSSAMPVVLDQLWNYYSSHAARQALVTHLSKQPESTLTYSLSSGLILYKDSIFIPDIDGLRRSLIFVFHATTEGGHSRARATAARLSASFYWPKLLAAIKAFIRQCAICQSNKCSTQKQLGTLQPLPIPRQVWEDLSMDFITHLPVSAGKTVIWVIFDRLTKYAHFISLPPRFTAVSLASEFSRTIYRLHGLPKSIVSDRDRIFHSNFWRELFRLSGTTLAFSSAYHPQTDVQMEVLNRVLETYLRCFVAETPRRWSQFLHLAEYWYNTTRHMSIGMPPFRALYGRNPPLVVHYLTDQSKVAAVGDLIRLHRDALAVARYHLSRAQQQSVHRRVSHKLGCCFFGPFFILRQIGPVTYELELPAGARIHPVFQVSLLKPFVGEPPATCGALPPDVMNADGPRHPCRILAPRAGSLPTQPQFLIQWEDQDASDASWVSLDELRSAHPALDLEDKVQIDEGSIDTAQTMLSPVKPEGPSTCKITTKR
ncbi:UNVERIFIED_CONTAM: Retrovirus-related Pol polyprotein from transposon [Sesamum radiatum]|uniref:Retrovirus-related Pol polyprotein from transposon n=1 Tax=Sesamum radiatum TaxID=300843 RepID=A0AAW2V7G4_SESRA